MLDLRDQLRKTGLISDKQVRLSDTASVRRLALQPRSRGETDAAQPRSQPRRGAGLRRRPCRPCRRPRHTRAARATAQPGEIVTAHLRGRPAVVPALPCSDQDRRGAPAARRGPLHPAPRGTHRRRRPVRADRAAGPSGGVKGAQHESLRVFATASPGPGYVRKEP